MSGRVNSVGSYGFSKTSISHSRHEDVRGHKNKSKRTDFFHQFKASTEGRTGPRVKSKLPQRLVIGSLAAGIFLTLALLFGYLLASGKWQPLLKTLSPIPSSLKDWAKGNLFVIARWLLSHLAS